jgi:hypothetical protein
MDTPSRREIRRHQPLITLRIPFDVQPLPPPPTITLRTNFESTLRPSVNRKPQFRRPQFLVPVPVASGSAMKSRKEASCAAPAAQRASSDGRNRIADDAEPDLSDLSDVSDSESQGSLSDSCEAPVQSTKIQKPPGEAGRPKSGGFNLEETLGWSKEFFNKIQVRCASINIIQTSRLIGGRNKYMS